MAIVTPRRDPRLVGYAALALGFTAVALASGRPLHLGLAAPFALAVTLGIRGIRPEPVTMRVAIPSATVFVDDEVAGAVIMERSPGLVGWVALERGGGWTALEPEPHLAWEVRREGAAVEAPFTVLADRWGAHPFGDLHTQLRRPFGLIVWEQVHPSHQELAVLPRPEQVRQLLPPPASQATAGSHLSRLVGDGFDYAELRPFSVGDRLRDVNWRTSARFDTLHVNRRHPDRTGDVVLILDTSADGVGVANVAMQAALEREARAAWSVAHLHLGSQDRVGLAVQGRIAAHIRPRSGDRARYELLGTLLRVGGRSAAGGSTGPRSEGLDRMPAQALLVAFSPLVDHRFANELFALHQSGRPVMVVVIELLDLLPEPTDEAGRLARRLYRAQLNMTREILVASGMPLATWSDETGLGDVVAVLRRLRRAVVRR